IPMNNRLRDAYLRMSDTVQGAVSPVGVAWKRVRDNHPSIQLYSGDGSHPSYAGSYLAACTFYSSVFRKPASGATFVGSLDPVTAAILQDAATFVVLDSLEQWNLRPISEHTQAGFSQVVTGSTLDLTNTSTKANGYSWDFGDGNSSIDENPSHTYASNGTYSVSIVASSPCDTDTLVQSVTISIAGMNKLPEGYKLQSFGNGHYTIIASERVLSMTLIDPMGRKLETKLPTSNSIELNLERQPDGLFLILLETELGIRTIRVLR
ncbi:MAG: PKD domain-containing protein, partial [Crocinitomicaceae bacterium]|nr:PKD domain-containing protein [Crocinitomicaceae bacterium]